MNRLRALGFNLAFYSVTALMSLLLLWTLPLPRRAMIPIVHLWLKQVVWIERHIAHLDYRVLGQEYIPDGACIIAAKHQSAWETFKLHLLFGDPAIVLKQELLSIPVWGWYLQRAGMIPIDRKAGASALSSMLQAAHRAKTDGRKIVIFPQGTRIAPGEHRAYKNGVGALYQELDLPVIPMALNSGLFWPKNGSIKRPGTITIEFLPPIMPGLSREAFMARLKDELENAADRLVETT